MLGLRYCRNHPEEPLLLRSKRSGTYWYCGHPEGCAYTENVTRFASGSRQPRAYNFRSGQSTSKGGDKVSMEAIRHVEGRS